ncbi:hypothetical protein RRG08_036456 [Elysia crispata]|uniref:Uncharacterized protein n=1 Tax=Elysia crispata TaxID=231223 RepID=A0AAE0ZL10_9GAST|nr:hypothetical protein RRG08_036456 [Elysia crispata]
MVWYMSLRFSVSHPADMIAYLPPGASQRYLSSDRLFISAAIQTLEVIGVHQIELMMECYGWAVFVAILFFINGSLCEPCQTSSRSGGVHIFNCSKADLKSLPDVPSEAQVLDFSLNQFQSLPVIPESPSCEIGCGVDNSSSHCRLNISFSNNQIKSFERGALNRLQCLRVLDLSYNDIKADIFRPTFSVQGVYYLERLILRGNPLGELPDNAFSFPFMDFLNHLDLSSCKLTQIGPISVDDLEKLMTLNLSSNKLTDIDADTFKGLLSLNQLDLSENKLTYFSEHVFGDLEQLRDLRLNGNDIEGFHDNAFSDECGLSNFDLTDNSLRDVPYAAINKLQSLETLNLSKNPIKKVSSSGTPNKVRHLVLNDMPLLTEIRADDLAAFSNLVSLSISGSTVFRKIHNGALSKNFPFLTHVRLENNRIATLESDALPWEQLTSLSLGGNPWLCDDRLSWMLKADCIKGPIICAGPGNLKGRDFMSLDATDLNREVPIIPMASIVISLLAIPVVCACAVFVWRRRRFCPCPQHELQGRYVSVFTRDGDEDTDIRVDVRLRENANRIVAVSNGSADDTQHLVKIGEGGGSKADAYETEEEEI